MIHEETLVDLGEFVQENLGEIVKSYSVENKELCVIVNRDDLIKVMLFLRNNGECLFSMLIDICGVDYPNRSERFDVVYNLLSLRHNNRIRVKVTTDEKHAVPSLYSTFSSAGWYEREAWDMYGILFDNHPDLRRILTDYGFKGHPMRKDFPLTGYTEVRYDENLKRIVHESVKLEQEFRNFDNISPWESMGDITTPLSVPSDDKASK